jgi:hypothetical protein
VEPAVVSHATREPVDVRKALRRARTLRNDEELAVELVDMAYHVDAATVIPFLEVLKQIEDETWRTRTLFSVFQQTATEFTRALPVPAQDAVVALVEGIGDEAARATALRNLSSDLPEPLRARLAGLAEGLTDPRVRLQTILHYETDPSDERKAALLERARLIDDEEKRAGALAAIAPLLPAPLLVEAFAAANSIKDPGAAGLALVSVAGHFADEDERERAQFQILERASAIADPVRKFDVLAALGDLPPEARRTTESTLFDLATKFEDPDLRCRAMFMAGDFAQDEVGRTKAFLAGIAAAERLGELRRRGELLQLLRPLVSWVDPAVRAEVRRAVDRFDDPGMRHELRSTLSRFMADGGPQERAALRHQAGSVATPGAEQARDQWDVFISYATADVQEARSLSFDLKSRGLRVFLAADTLDAEVGSSGWTAAIDDAIESTRAMLVLVTNNALRSKWVAQEWGKYYRVMVDNESGRLFSLRLSGPAIAELPLTLRMYQVIDSPNGQIEPDHFTRILDLVRGR